MSIKTINSVLISVYNKDVLLPYLNILKNYKGKIISTGGTSKFLNENGINVIEIDNLTNYPALLDGRVKTLHPVIIGGILLRRDNENDKKEAKKYNLEEIDAVLVDLYPFAETIKTSIDESEIIEKIDIGGITLIRAAAKNFKDVLVAADSRDYPHFFECIKNGYSEEHDRRHLAKNSFAIVTMYDATIFQWFSQPYLAQESKIISKNLVTPLRYGENPHQQAFFLHDESMRYEKHHGKELSYNNFLDIDSAWLLVNELNQPSCVVVKHTNPCGVAIGKSPIDAFDRALAGDPVSAYGGIFAFNTPIDDATIEKLNSLFFEVLIVPHFTKGQIEKLSIKKNRILLSISETKPNNWQWRSVLGGSLVQQRDDYIPDSSKWEWIVKNEKLNNKLIDDMKLGVSIVKYLKSNAITIVKDNQLLGMGCGQPSRVDSTRIAIEKAKTFGHDLTGAILASDGFFPFTDSIDLAYQNGIVAVVEPGGSIHDKNIISFCQENDIILSFTKIRNFKH
ncbi:MAG: bifunctional phosphoribosylaminoimidazolecarboxamide formyltransferase/IMP cyclohydrolase [Bacteroidales bacterium]|jgi:phosphoribosylaminoimidazolecarboxamide formyltransferase/IMP cyclohydrolase|nr:bifunctional phosphoribosylaminoimidazolecarboxamide formyltransferase/IMP cyclohydrolase [Bacteroidales bacterium]MDI9575018.1 bifunctional phosphoribosylaminoimidazolecarboxamide formyltransferase/IMP cyclohydrolase [Bacteroidota bacterium]HPZ74393.1 bifunctional phosphoribosylaminoimidazolecarboxamide formyltransferase/IMP cyclohydrolase [Candidatus Pacearchaeota archaeon]MDY0401079.1 bifunctional phosphoribosylaminoimidazolecarboxamide formyltransferase/IMP cyclohydrolase [Bacteroidales b